jgi:hypothetical protein
MKLRSLIKSSVVFLLAVASVSAQSAPAPAPAPKADVIPRAADRHPDLSGIWSNATRTPFERPDVFGGRATISDDEARKWEARENQRWAEGSTIDGGRPVTIQGGAYNVLFYDNGSELARIGGQKRTSMVVDPPDGHVPPLVLEAAGVVRKALVVAGDIAAAPRSIALVVETTNFNDQTHYRGSSMNLKVTERFTRVSEKTIEYRATMEDPSTWTKPWSIELAFSSVPGPLYEYACHEGNYAIVDILGAK